VDLRGLISRILHNFSVVRLELFDLTRELFVLWVITHIHNTILSDNMENFILHLSFDCIKPVATISQLDEVKKDRH